MISNFVVHCALVAGFSIRNGDFLCNKELENGKLLRQYNIQENDTVDVVLTEIQDNISLRAVNRKLDFFLPVLKALHLSHVSLKRLLNSESMKD